MRSDTPLGILALALLLAGLAMRSDDESQTAQDALWSVGAPSGADAPAGKGLPSELVPDGLMLARWSAAAGLDPAEDMPAVATRETAPRPRRSAESDRDAGTDALDHVADAETLQPR
jgi:hypothetical protein